MKRILAGLIVLAVVCTVSMGAFDEDFESYEVGSFPSTWVPKYNATNAGNAVVIDPTNSDNQMLQLKSQSGWAPHAYHRFDFGQNFMIKMSFLQQQGNWPILDISSSTNNSNYLRLFQLNGSVINTLAGQADDVQVNFDQWNDLKIVYQRDNLVASLQYCFNDEEIAIIDDISFVNESSAYDNRFGYLMLGVGNYGAHYGNFDNIYVTNDISCPPPSQSVPTPSAMLLTGIGVGAVRLIRRKK